ncbi:MAG: DUF3592 domain-containing protein [Clostridiales bacterium]|nr:DUF3592 domain-containing protein [Clostridiales bacterium]
MLNMLPGRRFEKERSVARRIMGIVFIIFTVFGMYVTVSNYMREVDQKDWQVVEAQVTDVQSRKVSSGGIHSSSRTVYDIRYTYHFDGDLYVGTVYGSGSRRAIGEIFSVKCDPDNPEESTDVLEPQTSNMIFLLILCVIFLMVGLMLCEIIPGIVVKNTDKGGGSARRTTGYSGVEGSEKRSKE